MIVYREQRRRIPTAEAIRRVEAASGFERLMELGELEAGVADALCPERDDDLPPLGALRRGEWRGLDLPREIEISVPEGFAYYALDPELYRIAARRFAAECRPERAAVIGIRSIGATLSAIVEAELAAQGCHTGSWTVRPRGHPWNRHLCVSGALDHAWRVWDGWFAIVDEGPGLSGSSFASVAAHLAGLGVPDERIVFFPSWIPSGAGFVSDAARDRWRCHTKFAAGFEELGRFREARNLSAGKWRELTGSPAAVQPQHERRKYLEGDRLYKFAGYGRYGRAALERAEALRGWTPETLGLEDGFLATRWVEGRPAGLSEELIEHAAAYLTFVRREFATGETAQTAALAEMIDVNAGLEVEPGPPAEAIALDARMLSHEWLETAGGFLKTDALEHHDDHFFPGPQDIAWDVAAFGIEVGGDDYLLDCYVRESRDASVRARLPFYRTAYLAFRVGYADLAAQALGDCPDGVRFRGEKRRYEALLGGTPWTMTTANRSSA
ncbi:MAG TPA: hypothetical protein VGF59_09360 [Bryobacteraceae bacterium]